jgi:hypothetical protein
MQHPNVTAAQGQATRADEHVAGPKLGNGHLDKLGLASRDDLDGFHTYQLLKCLNSSQSARQSRFCENLREAGYDLTAFYLKL